MALPENRAELLFPLMRAETPHSAADLPDDAQICNCNGVTKGRLPEGDRRGLPQPAVALRRDTRRHRLRLVQDAGAAGARGGAGDEVKADPAAH